MLSISRYLVLESLVQLMLAVHALIGVHDMPAAEAVTMHSLRLACRRAPVPCQHVLSACLGSMACQPNLQLGQAYQICTPCLQNLAQRVYTTTTAEEQCLYQRFDTVHVADLLSAPQGVGSNTPFLGPWIPRQHPMNTAIPRQHLPRLTGSCSRIATHSDGLYTRQHLGHVPSAVGCVVSVSSRSGG